MPLFVCQVKTGDEKKVIQYLQHRGVVSPNVKFHTPERELSIRRAGRVRKERSLLFPSYLFVETETVEPEMVLALRKIPGFYRFLPDNQAPQALSAAERDLLRHLIHGGRVLGHSKVIFREQGRIQVLSGPLQGLEGCIVKVNRRKQRIRIRLDLYQNSHLIDLGFEEAAPSQETDGPPAEGVESR